MEKQKRRRGDRRDGRLLRELDSLHFITGIIYPNRCDNEAYISERIDLTPVKEYIARRNETETDFPYTYFHLVLTALVKTITLRPKMNRFIVNGNFFQRNEVTASFVVKKQFSDKGAEALAMLAREDVPEEVSKAYGGKKFSFGPDYIIPSPLDPRIIEWVTPAVARAAMESGVARARIEDLDAYRAGLRERVARMRHRADAARLAND